MQVVPLTLKLFGQEFESLLRESLLWAAVAVGMTEPLTAARLTAIIDAFVPRNF